MPKLKTIAIAAYFALASLALNAQTQITLTYPHFPPFTYSENGQAKGIGVEILSKVFQDLKLELKLIPSPNYDRALMNTAQSKADGFFLATENNERNLVGELSDPIVLNRWCWFSLANNSPQPSKSETVGTILNTNTHKWLDKNSYQSHGVTEAEKLILLLRQKRISSVFIAEMAFKQAVKEKGLDMKGFSMKIEAERNFGIYLSHKFLSQHPEFLEKLNERIKKYQNLGLISL